MSRKYKFANKEGLYFVSFATVNWIDVFIRPEYNEIIIDSLTYCQNTLVWNYIVGALCQAISI
ncbi:hypothetical protein JN11_02032 [Mucilaginibacter frigoritolerans]|uniref:Transposase n=1 Tax=Mucilaginibacter frigoritolerans TaxID=652788 RepID=A0A562U4L7_9SPHI|nr:hypothetical protein [Mucilaginibacter frigoritolerans]TWJ00773.1 hypothetical protein JN11_02032 [Mucilaginibacter frigoritolerans]